jgi:hypothetical protein
VSANNDMVIIGDRRFAAQFMAMRFKVAALLSTFCQLGSHSTMFLTKATRKYGAVSRPISHRRLDTFSQHTIYQSCVKTLVDASFSG